jgi:hypothetical protein
MHDEDRERYCQWLFRAIGQNNALAGMSFDHDNIALKV